MHAWFPAAGTGGPGRIEYLCGDSTYLLEPGDAMQFVGEVPHGPRTLIELPIQFLSVKSIQPAS